MKQILFLIAILFLSISTSIAQIKPPDGTKQATTNQTFIAPDSTLWDRIGAQGMNAFFEKRVNLKDLLKKQSVVYVNVMDFGADSTGVKSNLSALTKAFNFAKLKNATGVYIPKGVFRLDSVFNKSAYPGISLIGAGSTQTIITGKQGTYSGYALADPDHPCLIYATGSETLIGQITVPAILQRSYVIAGAGLNLKEQDVIKIIDTRNYSWITTPTGTIDSISEPSRAYYRNGELFTVRKYSNDTVYLDHAVTYPFLNPATTNIYRMNMSQHNMSGMTINTLDTLNTRSVYLSHLLRSRLEDLNINGAGQTTLDIRNAYHTVISQVSANKYSAEVGIGTSTSYGMILVSSQNVTIENSSFFGTRHGIAMSGSGFTPLGVINRYINVYGNKVSAQTDNAMDTHGNSDFIRIHDNFIDNGVTLRGGNLDFYNNTVFGTPSAPKGIIYVFEMKNNNFRIRGNKVDFNNTGNSSSALMYVEPRSYTDTTGVFNFSNNDIKFIGATGNTTAFNLVSFIPEDAINYPAKIDILDNTITGTPGRRIAFRVGGASTSARTGHVRFEGNAFENIRFVHVFGFSSIIRNNVFSTAFQYSAGASDVYNVVVENNTFRDFVKNSPGGTANVGSAIWIAGATNAWVSGNTGQPSALATWGATYATITNLYEGINRFGTLNNNYTSITNRGFYTIKGLNVSLGSDATGDIYTRDANGNLSRIADVATGSVLKSGGIGVAPLYGKVGLTTDVSGILPVANGGTGKATITVGAIQKGNGTGALADAVSGTDYATPASVALKANLAGGNAFTGNQTYTNNIFGSTADFSGNLTSVGFQSTFGNFTSVNPLGLGPFVSSLSVNNISSQRQWEMPNQDGVLAIASNHYIKAEVDSKISGAGGATQSGTYNPTVTGVLNLSSATGQLNHYSRIGNQVTVTGAIAFTPTGGATSVSMTISLPLPSNLVNSYDAVGTGSSDNGSATNVRVLKSNAFPTTAEIFFTSNASPGTVYYTFTYSVL